MNIVNKSIIILFGVFKYEDTYLKSTNLAKNFVKYDFIEKNKKYLEQKYYSNWLDQFSERSFNRQLRYLKNEIPDVNVPLEFSRNIKVKIEGIIVYLFEDRIAIFSIKTSINTKSLSDLSMISNYLRQVTKKQPNSTLESFSTLIEEKIIKHFTSDLNLWRKLNSSLKVYTLVDLSSEWKMTKVNQMLFDLGTFQKIGNSKGGHFFSPSKSFFKETLMENSIDAFENWKALCLFDSFVRISFNLEQFDLYDIWENEYTFIYVYTLYMRYYLNYTNSRLSNAMQNLETAKDIRNDFLNHKNTHSFYRISNNFLPNMIYQKMIGAQEVNEELALLEERIVRIDLLIREKEEIMIRNILFALTVLSLISIFYDGNQFLSNYFKFSNGKAMISMSVLLFIIIIIFILKYYRRK